MCRRYCICMINFIVQNPSTSPIKNVQEVLLHPSCKRCHYSRENKSQLFWWNILFNSGSTSLPVYLLKEFISHLVSYIFSFKVCPGVYILIMSMKVNFPWTWLMPRLKLLGYTAAQKEFLYFKARDTPANEKPRT